MRRLGSYVIWTFTLVLLMVQEGMCQGESTALPNWLVGTISVCVFLILAFAFMLVNHYFCANLYVEEAEDEESGYENHVFEVDQDMPKERIEGVHTPLATKEDDGAAVAEEHGYAAAVDEEHEYAQIHRTSEKRKIDEDSSQVVTAPPQDNVMSTAL